MRIRIRIRTGQKHADLDPKPCKMPKKRVCEPPILAFSENAILVNTKLVLLRQ